MIKVDQFELENCMNRHTRLTALLDLVLEREEVRVEEIVETLGVSPATVRRDLDNLAQQQLITRTHGGARLHPSSSDLPLRYKSGRNADERSRIAKAAIKLIRPGEVIGLNGGTTTTEVGREIALAPESDGVVGDQRFIVVTNAVNIANELTVRPRVKVVVTGGVARPHSYELTGPLSTLILTEISIDTLFLGVNAISADLGAAAHNEGEASINAAFVKVAKKVVVVADSSKVGQTAFARICDISEVHTLITDGDIEPSEVARFEAAGVKVIVA